MDTQKIVQEVIENIILESKKKAFKSEYEIRGNISGNFRYLLRDNFEVIRDFPTNNRYKRKENELLFEDSKGNHGYVDLGINKDSSPFIGIELEYPRGKGLKEEKKFQAHLKNDLLKLLNEVIALRYLLVFTYNDPPFDYQNIIRALKFNEVKFAYIRLFKSGELEGKKAVKESVIIPDDWINIENLNYVR